MIDLLGTLAPGHGVASGYQIVPPRPPVDPLWRTLVVLADTDTDTDTDTVAEDGGDAPAAAPLLSRRVVGAYGATRADSVPRGVGEAVERFALLPPSSGAPDAAKATAEVLARGGALLDFALPGVALGSPGAWIDELRWYPGRRLSSGEQVWVPAALVDDPVQPADNPGWFDSGPSGAAAGPDLERATARALLEIIERDAFMVAWERELRLPLLDPDRLLRNGSMDASGRDARRRLAVLRDRLAAAGLLMVIASLPCGVPQVRGVVAVVIDLTSESPIAAVGCKASFDQVDSAAGAIQEALQIRSTMINGRQRLSSGPPDEVVTDEDRVRWLASRHGFAAVSEWVAGFRAATEPAPTESVAGPSSGSGQLVDAIVADGGDPIVVELTGRLPEPLRVMGWAAVKVIPVGYQHLRIDERMPHSWNVPRLASATERTGVPARAPWPSATDEPHRPHPLP
jgi:ribosomal protein S12 methylthiotransferase accessory factor